MLKHMRTTVLLPDELHRRAKAYAAEHGITLAQLLADALHQLLAGEAAREGRVAYSFQPLTETGGTLPGVDLSDNGGLRDIMDGLA